MAPNTIPRTIKTGLRVSSKPKKMKAADDHQRLPPASRFVFRPMRSEMYPE